MKYFPSEIEAKWQQYWAENQTFAAQNPTPLEGLGEEKPKYYVLDMFPYPSGAGLHVGHPLGYIASDIVARYKRHKGFNVLHPQGYDSFGLPAEQYAIQTGQHPSNTTEINIEGCLDQNGDIFSKYVNEDGTIKDTALIEKSKKVSITDENYRDNIIKGYRRQLDKIGFSFDWSREVRTSNADYYKHTQWIFIQLFNSWYNKDTDKAEDIKTLISIFEKEGNSAVNAVCDDHIVSFSSSEWTSFSSEAQQQLLLQYRLTYLAETEVNWCAALGTVLANDEIVNGVSERGGHPVVRKKMTQWSMRISAYAERLLQGLNDIDWTESLKESQRNWIGKSVGATIEFPILTFPKGEGTVADVKPLGYMTGGNNSHINIHHAKDNRKNPTVAEKVLWQELRNKKLEEKFRQQHLVDDFIVDFVCLSKKLVIEVDGGYHNDENQRILDEERAFILNKKGYKVVRFTNDEVIKNISSVLESIKEELKLRQTFELPTPSPSERVGVRVFTTRPDTIFGVTFMTLAPEHDLVAKITTPEQKEIVENYIQATSKRSERERMADVKTISGVFTGAYAEHPFTKEPIPVWIGDYVLAGYGTGAVMAVPCGDERDYAFANFFKGSNGMPEIKNIFDQDISEAAFGAKEGFQLVDSDFLNGLGYKEGTKKTIEALEKINQGNGKTNYRLRDAVFSRQRYWGEPFPVYYVNGLPQMIDKKYLPIALPEVEKYLPTEDGQPPLGNAKEWYWNTKTNSVCSPPLEGLGEDYIFPLELNTMPGWAGSSWYWMRYMDAHNEEEFASKEALDYWQNVDLYIGGSEHATGHLLYARFWNKFLKDRGFAPTEEPFKKLINQGMILGMSAFVYRLEIGFSAYNEKEEIEFKKLISSLPVFILPKEDKGMEFHEFQSLLDDERLKNLLSFIQEKNTNNLELNYGGLLFTVSPIHVDVSLVNLSDELNIEEFRKNSLYSDYKDAVFVGLNGDLFFENNGKYIVGREVEKMSKSKYNVVNPDEICNEYGADTLRLYEMFLGPLEQAKPWNTAGITGVFGFLKKLWRLYFDDNGFIVTNDEPTPEMYKSLHKTIKKVTEDIENFSFNTSVSQFMICVNELATLKCHHRAILEPLALVMSPYAPHIAEELWSALGHEGSIALVDFPIFDPKYLVESEKEYPVSFNGKMRFTMNLPLDLTAAQIEEIVMADERTIAQLAGNTPKKVIIVPGKIINLVG